MNKLSIEKLEFLENIFNDISKGNDFDLIFDSIYKNLIKFIPYNRIGVGVLSFNEKEIFAIANMSDSETYLGAGYSIDIDKTSLKEIIDSGNPRIINDLDEYIIKRPDSESTMLILKEGIKSSLTLPLIIDKKVTGLIFFSSKEKNIYSTKHIEFLNKISLPIAVLIERARIITKLKERNRQLDESNGFKNQFLNSLKKEVELRTKNLKEKNEKYEIMLELSKSFSKFPKLNSLIKDFYDKLSDYLNLDAISFIRKSYRKNKIKLVTITEEETLIERFDIFDSIYSSNNMLNKLNTTDIINFEDIKQDFFEKSFILKNKLNYSILLPIKLQDELLGILVLSRKKHQVFTQKECSFIKELIEIFRLNIFNKININQINHDKSKLKEKSNYLSEEIKVNFGEIIGESKKLKKVLMEIEKVAPTQSTVFIRGETGVGKELIARAIHNNSRRKDNIFVKVNCAALSDSLITSEFFGHEKGAFTGAFEKKIGKFELANGGTIFLDEIGEIPIDIQVKLLRVLQERELERVGGNKTIRIDVRVIAATNKNIEEEIVKNKFRADLFYRLNVFPLYIPSLKERKDDILPLTKYFMQKYSKIMNRNIEHITTRSEEFLLHYLFPGNIRELENMIERAVILAENNTLDLQPLTTNIQVNKKEEIYTDNEKFLTLDELIEIHLKKAMEKTKWKIYGDTGAAKLLDMKPTTLQSKLKKFGIK
jgi:formate hydrogenlyase transcriptional activator